MMPYAAMSNGETRDAVVNRGYRMPAPKRAPAELQQLMVECWAAEPEDRPTMADIVDYLREVKGQHPER